MTMDVWVLTLGADDDAGSKTLGVFATKDAARPTFEKNVRDLVRFGRQVDEAFATDESVFVQVGLDWLDLRRFPVETEAGQPALTA